MVKKALNVEVEFDKMAVDNFSLCGETTSFSMVNIIL